MSNVPTPVAKDQHYIPKFYLKGFTEKPGRLWVCERFKPIRSSKPKDEAHRPDYYTHVEGEQRDETVENILASVESRVAPIICKLANPQYVLTPENASHLITFVASMFVRVPSWREYLDNMAARMIKETGLKVAREKNEFHKFCEDFERSKGQSLGMEYEELRQYVLAGDFDILPSVTFNLRAMFDSAITVVAALKDYGCQTLHGPAGKFFLTSDSPVWTIQPDGRGQAAVGMGFGWPGVELFFPLNKRTCLRMRVGIQPCHKFVDEKRVDQINNMTMATAARYLYSSEGYKRIERLFNERGCKVRPGKESFLPRPTSRRELL